MNDINVGKFFHIVDRNYLRSTSELIPSVCVDECFDDSADNFDSVQKTAQISGRLDDSESDPDLFPLASPINTSIAESDSSDDGFRFLAGTRNFPKTVDFTDSDTDLECLLELKDFVRCWSDRPIKYLKYVDDCLSLEKVCFGPTGGRVK